VNPGSYFTKAYVPSLMFTCPASPEDSMRLAVFSVSPQMSYANFFAPLPPATTGPV
jgi:hypothetical protein